MKKVTGMIFAVMMVLVSAGVAFACWDGSGAGCGQGYSRGVNAESMKKFQKESLGLRDDLMVRQIELQAEYDKPALDRARIASIKKDIIDIQAKIQVVADKHGIPAGGPGSRGGMMAGRGGRGTMMGAEGSCPQCQ